MNLLQYVSELSCMELGWDGTGKGQGPVRDGTKTYFCPVL